MAGLALILLAPGGCGRPGGPPSANGDPEGAWPELPELDGEEVIAHNGGEVGTSAEILLRRRDGLGLVVRMNSEGRARTLEPIERALMEAAASP